MISTASAHRLLQQEIQALPDDLTVEVLDFVQLLKARRKELEEHAGHYWLWLPRDDRLVWTVFEDEQIVDLLYVGPKTPDLYKRLGLGRSSPQSDG